MIVAGIDPSLTNTGIAILHNGAPILLHAHGYTGHDADSYTIRNRRIRALCAYIRNAIDTALNNERPDFVVIEGPAFSKSQGKAHDRAGLWHGLFGQWDARRVPVAVVTPQSAKLWATGNGNASKELMLATARVWWPDKRIKNDNVADAAALALAGAHRLGEPIPFEPKQRQLDALNAVAWPEAVRA